MPLKDTEYQCLPKWLQTVWNMDKAVARQAEEYIDELIEGFKKGEQLDLQSEQPLTREIRDEYFKLINYLLSQLEGIGEGFSIPAISDGAKIGLDALKKLEEK